MHPDEAEALAIFSDTLRAMFPGYLDPARYSSEDLAILHRLGIQGGHNPTPKAGPGA